MLCSERRIRVAVVEDETSIRRLILRDLGRSDDLEVVADSVSGLDALELVNRHEPDVLILDLGLPVHPGPPIIKRLVAHHPRTRIVLFTGAVILDVVVSCIREGAMGYVGKGGSLLELRDAVRAVARGEFALGEPLTVEGLPAAYAALDATSPDYYRTFTQRERDVLHRLGDVLSSHEIAADLGIGHRTVDEHRARLIAKLGLNGYQGLQQYAVRRRRILGPASGI